MVTHPTVTLCGPQRLVPTIGKIAAELGITGTVATVTAGWREREPSDGELQEHLGLPTVNLGLYDRWKRIAEVDAEYFALHRERQDRLRSLQEVYRRRLRHAMDGARAVFTMEVDDDILGPEKLAAIDAIGELDGHHLVRVKAMHVEFEQRVQPGKRRAIAQERDAVAELLDGVDSVFIAGGHVAVLLNRLRLLALRPLLARRNVVAWSAGAMAMTSHVLLFHDFPPWGAGDAEVLDHGLGLATGIVALPHAHRRLALDNAQRVAAMARRAAPSVCLALPDGAHVVTRNHEVLSVSDGIVALRQSGDVVELPDADQLPAPLRAV